MMDVVDDGCGGCCRVQRLSAEMLRPFAKFVLLEPTPSHPQAPLLRLQLQQLLLHVCRHSAAGDTWLSLLLDALPCYQVGEGGGCKGRVGGGAGLCVFFPVSQAGFRRGLLVGVVLCPPPLPALSPPPPISLSLYFLSHCWSSSSEDV